MTWDEDYYLGSSDYPRTAMNAWEHVTGSPDGYYLATATGGLNRPTWLIENEDELILAYEDHQEPRLTCAYCTNRLPRTRDVRKAIHWYHTHDCAPQEAGEAHGIILDHTPFPQTLAA